MNGEIDIVIPWVNPNDDVWFNDYKEICKKCNGDKDPSRIRDFGLFPYFFRCISENASWVRKVHLLLYSKTQIPSWLNTNCPKLQIHYHNEFIEPEYLPTYNSMHYFRNVWKLNDLAENFIWLNDDVFIVNKTNSDDFFVDNIPVDSSELSKQINSNPVHEEWLNKHNITWNNGRQKLDFFQNIVLNCLKITQKYTGEFNLYRNLHTGISCNKTEVKTICTNIYEDLIKANKPQDKIRTSTNVSEDWIYRYIRLNNNNFVNKKETDIKIYLEPHNDNYKKIMESMMNYKVVCLNDCLTRTDNFNLIKDRLTMLFNTKFPNKCEFEV